MEWRVDISGAAFEKASPVPPCKNFENGVGGWRARHSGAGQVSGMVASLLLLQDDFLRCGVENLPIFSIISVRGQMDVPLAKFLHSFFSKKRVPLAVNGVAGGHVGDRL